MPPIMGAAAFIMTEYVGVPYATVATAAVIPAILYFTGIFLNVHYEAVKTGLRGIPKEQRPNTMKLFKEGWYMMTPVILLFGMLIGGSSAMKAAMYGIIGCIIVWIVNILKEERKFDVVRFVKMFIDSLDESARSAVTVAITCGTAGIIVGVVTMTGLGLKMADGLIALAGGSLLLTMVFTMFSSLILGMGVPTTANYIIQATISAPALVALGVPPIAAHIFVFYFGTCKHRRLFNSYIYLNSNKICRNCCYWYDWSCYRIHKIFQNKLQDLGKYCFNHCGFVARRPGYSYRYCRCRFDVCDLLSTEKTYREDCNFVVFDIYNRHQFNLDMLSRRRL